MKNYQGFADGDEGYGPVPDKIGTTSNQQEIALTIICRVSDDENPQTDRDQAKAYAKDAITNAVKTASLNGFITFLGTKSESMSMEIDSILIDPLADIIHETAEYEASQERLRNGDDN